MRCKNILIVHNVENLSKARRSTLDHVYCFERYAPQHNYVYHRVMLPVTEALRAAAWDAVIFESTSLGIVTLRPRSRFQHLREAWRFLRDSPAVKLVFPQDDATHSAYLDYFCSYIGADAVFSVRAERKEQLYPLTSAKAEFVSTVAGYIDDASLDEIAALGRPFAERRWEVGQRVALYPAWGGRFARRKGDVALRLQQACRERGLPENVSTDPTDVFVGDDWYRFLGDCRFVVGAEGGHGIWDPYGAIQDEVNDYVTRHPNASFEEVEDACFLGIDGRETFPGFAPRILEAALMHCGQILLEGAYRGFVQPGVHYIELNDDYSNIDDVFSQMVNPDRIQEMVAATRRDLVDNPSFRYSSLVQRTFELVERKQAGRPTTAAPATDITAVRAKHRLQLAAAIVADLRREGFRGDALFERAATVLRDQEAHPGVERQEAVQPFDWAAIILPAVQAPGANLDAERVQESAAPSDAAPVGGAATYLASIEAQAVEHLAPVVDAASAAAGGGDRDATAKLTEALRTARLWAEGLEGQVADLAQLARTIGADEPTRNLLEAVYTVRAQLGDSHVSEDLVNLVRSLPAETAMFRILAALGRNKSTLERPEVGDYLIQILDDHPFRIRFLALVAELLGPTPSDERLGQVMKIVEAGPVELRFLGRILEAVGPAPEEQKLLRVAQVVRGLLGLRGGWRAVDVLGRIVGR